MFYINITFVCMFREFVLEHLRFRASLIYFKFKLLVCGMQVYRCQNLILVFCLLGSGMKKIRSGISILWIKIFVDWVDLLNFQCSFLTSCTSTVLHVEYTYHHIFLSLDSLANKRIYSTNLWFMKNRWCFRFVIVNNIDLYTSRNLYMFPYFGRHLFVLVVSTST